MAQVLTVLRRKIYHEILIIAQFHPWQDTSNQNEKDAFERERDYMEHGPGKIDSILNDEMGRLF